ncbi:oxidoreductase [Anaerocolumna cellulosilytica]|uniref:Oxidoreductase n=1 Tax=Anaerocolumna cellulosilytica TaxID=433286 RepID=A0A6S6R938_9FIRM|nr:Gfo/Idh/MocA family oxidoreductase [Anaerocolumna cellulosilytica]MBB5197469.1 putative dehydrogenase [Anaerocolumna cellulosilytica]BCJ95488.1 oxidoreductase [Anaerocolumna cellulosilytica]
MKIGIVGCGFVASYYATTMPNHEELEIVGVTDVIAERARKFADYFHFQYINSLEDMLSNPEISIILNCTNPHNHYEVSKASLLAGKHVFTEKPMGMDFKQSYELVELAKQRNLYIISAPSIILGEYSQGLMKALNEKEIGKPLLAYAQLDDGAIHHMRYWTWISKTGVSWNYEDEFEVGSVLEHAGYCLTLLTAFFGPAKEVQAYTNCLVPNKVEKSSKPLGPDFTDTCIEFESGVVARLTVGSVAPNNHFLTIVGEDGVLSTDDLYWSVQQKVYIQKRIISDSNEREGSHEYLTSKEEYKFKRPDDFKYKTDYEVNVDWAKGVSELVAAISQNKKCRLDMDHALHVMEIIDVIENAKHFSGPQKIRTVFETIKPSDWLYDEK